MPSLTPAELGAGLSWRFLAILSRREPVAGTNVLGCSMKVLYTAQFTSGCRWSHHPNLDTCENEVKNIH